MARKSFALNKEPHVAELGDGLELKFRPEVMGDEFLDGFVRLQGLYSGLAEGSAGAAGMDVEEMREILRELRAFLFLLLMPESRDVFSKFVVVKAGEELAAYHTQEEADKHADGLGNAVVRDESLDLPLRALMEMLEWIAEVYGGGSRPTGSSTGSAAPSRSRGSRGTANSRSKG